MYISSDQEEGFGPRAKTLFLILNFDYLCIFLTLKNCRDDK